MPRLYQVTPEILGRRRATQRMSRSSWNFTTAIL
jgi:hypothetical protein